ncbi:unnamed protein product [Calicophoron daubneyi]|uniref:Glutamate--tRNA ligase n=1 Tax=Calicophoron daubneyi TaxID=300641 RepID=A0AAV2T5F1_CALDB
MESSFHWLLNFLKGKSVTLTEDELKRFSVNSITGDGTLEVINWVHFVPLYLFNPSTLPWGLSTLDKSLAHATYMVGSSPTIADLAIWSFIESSVECQKLLGHGGAGETATPEYPNLSRYYKHLASLESFDRIKTKLASIQRTDSKQETVAPPKTSEASSGKTTSAHMRFEVGGKFGELPGAKMGQVVVRFPPEASGYLHIGHAKAALLNQHYRDIFKGRLIMRFDDTNPEKEKADYEHSILSDLPRLGFHWDVQTRTSDYFEVMLQYCEKMIKEGKAYVDNTDSETMRIQRENRQASACRDNSIEKNLAWWEEMKQGTEFGQQCCVRAKIDMSSNNGALRDPTIYRCKRESHIRTGNRYSVYPLYDFACPIVDSIEGVTHALRTSEYNDRNDQYAWICQSLGLRCPTVIDYSRLALQNTVLSKRKLRWIVEEGLVDGWDDPRMPTVSGILRRGMTAEGLRQFILAQGSSRSSALMEWDKIWAFNKKVIDPVAPRYTGLLMDPLIPPMDDGPIGLVPVHIRGQKDWEEKQVPVHPKNESLGTRPVMIGPCVYIEQADALCFKEGENVTFINWGNCRICSVHKKDNYVSAVDAELNLEDTDYKKTLKITWLAAVPKDSTHQLTPVTCLIYDHLLNKAIIGKDEDFKQYVNRNSKTEQCLLGDPALRSLKKGDIIQLQRRGNYICDVPYEAKSAATGCESPCVLIQIPDGTSKSSGAEGSIVGMSVPDSKKGSVKANKVEPVELTEEEATKAAERQREKEEKKKARKEGRARAKQIKQEQDAGDQQSEAVKLDKPEEQINPRQVAKSESKKPQPAKADNSKVPNEKTQTKKQTKLALEATKEKDFSEWYAQVITKAELLEYYDISGCYILRPWAFSMWQTIQRYMDPRLEALGVENAYFPMFVSKSALEREKHHIADFAPEVAWVTRSGDTELAEPVAVRPTSETIMYPAFAKWIQSHRDLPLRLNQWSNIVRWEFKHPQPFLRTREFLWQEGHTAYADKADAEAEVLRILDLYADVYEDLLAVPVIKGRKTEKEKFPGAEYTTTVEVYIGGSGRGIQGATSHHLGQNFSRMFEVTYDHPVTGQPAFVYQNSWGLTTRTLGVLILVHGDNKGLILPPRIAPYQIVVVPCGITSKSTPEERDALVSMAESVTAQLKQDKAGFRVYCDDRTNISPGWKFNHWEMKGVPVRLEIGPQEVEKRSTCLVLRHNGQKLQVSMDELCTRLPSILDSIHADLLKKASAELSAHVLQVNDMAGLCAALDAKSLALAPFCGDSDCEDVIRNESARNVLVEPGAPSMGAKSLCIPFSCAFNPSLKCGKPAEGTKCFNHPYCSRPAVGYTLFGRSY